MTPTSRAVAHKIVDHLASHFAIVHGFSEDLYDQSRTDELTLRRSEAMYVLRQLGMTYKEIGRVFWGKDHTTVVHACQRVEKLMATEPGYKAEIATLMGMARTIVAVTKEKYVRERLADTREGVILHFVITSMGEEEGTTVDTDGYLRTGTYDNGRLGEIFITLGKPGSSHAAYDSWAKLFSKSLQRGVPLEELCSDEINTRFEPSGATNVVGVPRCTSPTDLVCRYLLLKYGKESI